MTREFLDVRELATHFNVSPDFVYRRLDPEKDNFIPHLRMGRKYRFELKSAAMERWLERNSNAPLAAEVLTKPPNMSEHQPG